MDESNHFFKKIGYRIADIRQKHNESQQVLADFLGKKREQVNYWENGTRSISVPVLAEIARHYGVSMDYLLGFTETASANPDIQNAVALTGLSEKAIETLNDIHRHDSIESGEDGYLTVLSDIITSKEFVPLLNDICELKVNLDELSLGFSPFADEYLKGIRIFYPENERKLDALWVYKEGKKHAEYLQFHANKVFGELLNSISNADNLLGIIQEEIKAVSDETEHLSKE